MRRGEDAAPGSRADHRLPPDRGGLRVRGCHEPTGRGEAIGDFLGPAALCETAGTAIAVSDEELLSEQAAAVRRLREDGWLDGDDEVVVLNTGAGLKYPQTLAVPTLPADGQMPPPQ